MEAVRLAKIWRKQSANITSPISQTGRLATHNRFLIHAHGPKPRPTGETRHPELTIKRPYNRIAKAKVTLAFIGLLYKPKTGILVGLWRARKPMQPVENE